MYVKYHVYHFKWFLWDFYGFWELSYISLMLLFHAKKFVFFISKCTHLLINLFQTICCNSSIWSLIVQGRLSRFFGFLGWKRILGGGGGRKFLFPLISLRGREGALWPDSAFFATKIRQRQGLVTVWGGEGVAFEESSATKYEHLGMISWIVTTIVICIFIDWERVFAKFLRRFRAARTVAGRREWHRVTWPEANATNGSVFIISPSNNQRLMPWRYSYDIEEGNYWMPRRLEEEQGAATVNFHKKEFQTDTLCTVAASFTRSRQNVSSICFNCVILFKDLIWYGSEIFLIDASTVIASETRHSLNKQGWKHHLEHIGPPITSTCVIETSIFKCPIIKANEPGALKPDNVWNTFCWRQVFRQVLRQQFEETMETRFYS